MAQLTLTVWYESTTDPRFGWAVKEVPPKDRGMSMDGNELGRSLADPEKAVVRPNLGQETKHKRKVFRNNIVTRSALM